MQSWGLASLKRSLQVLRRCLTPALFALHFPHPSSSQAPACLPSPAQPPKAQKLPAMAGLKEGQLATLRII